MVGFSWIRRFMYYPDRVVPPAEEVLPGAQEVAYDTEDGLTLHGWFLPADRTIATVVVFHGNGGTRADRADLAAGLAERGMAVLLAEYRGYGECPGSPTEDGLIADGRAARAYAEGRPGTDPGRLVLFGESLGSGVAVALATDCNPGTSYTTSMPFCIALAVREMRMTPAEALRAATFGGARALGRTDVGRVVVGGPAHQGLLRAPSFVHLAYRPGVDLVSGVWRRGEAVRGSRGRRHVEGAADD